MVLNGKQARCQGNDVGGHVNNGYLTTDLSSHKEIYTIDLDQSVDEGNRSEAGTERKTGPHYTLRNTLLGCFVTLMAAFFVAVGQSCIQVSRNQIVLLKFLCFSVFLKQLTKYCIVIAQRIDTPKTGNRGSATE